MKQLFYILLSLISYQSGIAQISIDVAGGLSGIMDNELLVGQIFARPNVQAGVSYALKINPDGGDNVAFQFGFQVAQKGYIQEIEDVQFKTRFYYLSLPLSVRYVVGDMFSIDAGVEANGLIDSSLNTDNRAKVSTLGVYESFDLSARLRVGLFAAERIEPYLNVSYGLTPILKYPRFDDFGNHLGEAELLKHIVYSLGIRINIGSE